MPLHHDETLAATIVKKERPSNHQPLRGVTSGNVGSQRGFALVATLALMILLTILAVGLLGLSSLSLRSSAQGSAQSQARANARVAMMIAIAELQKNAGSDMRITAPADILDASNPPLTGVWKSWEGSNQQQSGTLRGRPSIPDYSSKTKPASSSGGRFVSWLVSGATVDSMPEDANKLVGKIAAPGTVPLVGAGSLAEADLRQVHVVPQKAGDNGSFAWWVSGENQKALSPKPSGKVNPTTGEWADRIRSHSVADPEPFGMDRVLTNPELASKSFTRGSADFIADGAGAATPTESFHDLSAISTGLLTNVATGGWRKDLSLLTESWNAQPTTGLDFFKISPSESLKYTRPASATDYQPANSMLYHWADHRGSPLREFWARRGPVASWARIATYATLYKKMSATTTSAPNINHQSWPDDGTPEKANLTFHDIRLLPQMARIQMIVSHYATTQGADAGKYRPAVLYTPVVTVWNPYNTRLSLNGRLMLSPAYTWPLALRHKFTGSGAPSLAEEYWAVQANSSFSNYSTKCYGSSGGHQDFRIELNQNPMILEPGETRIFSPAAGNYQNITGNSRPTIILSPGVRTDAGMFLTLDRKLLTQSGGSGNRVSLPGSVDMGVDAKFDVPSRSSGGRLVCGTAYQWFIDSFGSGRSHSWYQVFYAKDDADKLYPPLTGLATATLSQCSSTPVPFLSITLGSRISNYRATATKGVVQANPVVDFFSSNGEPRFTDTYPGNDTLLNTPWDYSVVAHSAGPGDDMIPNADNTTSSSYIVTGVRKADGVSRLVAAELPTRPLVSLADLSQMDIRALNPTPPYSANNVANSDASPLIPRDNVVNPANARANTRSNEQQDDSYCSNQVLFDDWFFSSIAPEPNGFGSASGITQQKNFTDWLTGADPLANHAYRPIREDQVTDSSEASAIFTAEVQPADSWKTIASRIEVEGMFNVNSTSVKAWRALLGHARNHKIPYSRIGGGIGLSDETDYAFSRTSVAGDREAGEAPQVAGEYQDTTEFTGYRVFTDEMLDFLAEEIVEQVRKRGPFLSLSEFVNRQLSGDEELALAGAIQTALNALTADASLNPFETLQNESVASSAIPFGANVSAGYQFPKAAAGHNTYGLPGWTRQADILRPLAPILSARDDTFTIRAYGESRAANGTIQARAWCEAVVRRTRDFNDSSDAPDITTQPLKPVNITFGRRFEIVSFRWLNEGEV
jgi:type II secretory pathway pseudopilin PulG